MYCYVCGGIADGDGECLIPCEGFLLLDVDRPLTPEEVRHSRQQAITTYGRLPSHIECYQPQP